MRTHARVSNLLYPFSSTDIEGFAALAELALDLRWPWHHGTDRIWQQLDPTLWELTHNPWVVLQTVARAVRRTLRCFVDWGTLLETGGKGVYQAAPARPVQDRKLVVWLTEAALLTSRVHTGVLTALAHTPALFPFHLGSLYAVDLAGHSRLEPLCHGLNEDIVRFRDHEKMLKSSSLHRT